MNPLSDYVTHNEVRERLEARYGANLEKLPRQDKWYLLTVISGTLSYRERVPSDRYTLDSCLRDFQLHNEVGEDSRYCLELLEGLSDRNLLALCEALITYLRYGG